MRRKPTIILATSGNVRSNDPVPAEFRSDLPSWYALFDLRCEATRKRFSKLLLPR